MHSAHVVTVWGGMIFARGRLFWRLREGKTAADRYIGQRGAAEADSEMDEQCTYTVS